jgi:hypothetical protein
MKQVPSGRSTNIRGHHTKFSHLADLTPIICAPLIYRITTITYMTALKITVLVIKQFDVPHTDHPFGRRSF